MYVRAGGAPALRRVLEDFYARVFDDPMIGFLFAGKDRARLVEKELELMMAALGADVVYSGRPLEAVHKRLPIFGGHFDRRMQLLRETLADHDLPRDVQDAWLEHAASLRDQVTTMGPGDCEPERG
jgi:hemoglobin